MTDRSALSEIERCANCAYWSEFSLGQGHCERVGMRGSPTMLTDGGGLQTHPDFYCSEFDAGPLS